MSFFFLKKLVTILIMPVGLGGFLLSLGLVFLFTRRKNLGRGLALAGALVLYIFSLSPMANLLAGPLENRYPVLDPEKLPADLEAVVVLSGGTLDRRDLPPFAGLGGDTLKRMLEGIRLWKSRPGAKLILCGGDWQADPDFPLPAEVMADLAENQGVPREKLVLDTRSRDTYENAVEAVALLKTDNFAVVTTARHLVRAMAIFHKLGKDPIPSPTDHKLRVKSGGLRLLPSVGAMASSQECLHEYYGMVWYWLRGRL